MKNVKKYKPRFNKLLLVLFFSVIYSTLFAQAEFKEVLKFESAIDPNATIHFKNRSHNAEVKTWNNDAVELQLDVKIKAKKQEDIDKTVDALNGIEFKEAGSKFFINTTFWESMKSNTNYKFQLCNGEKVNLKDFQISITMYVPKTISMEVDSKYADLKMDEIAGELDLTMNSGKFYAGSFGGNAKFHLRYSKAFLENVPQANAELYDSDMELNTCGDLILQSKYSKIEIETAGDFTFESYDDKIAIGKLGKIKGEAKYSDFDFGPSVNLNFDFYDCNLTGGDTGSVNGKSKYSEIELGNTGNVYLDASYDDKFSFAELDSFECYESKYTDYNIEFVNSGFKLTSYDDNVKIQQLAPDFTEIKIDGKYGDFRLGFPESAKCQLLIDMKYGSVDYPEDLFERKTYIKENSKLFVDAKTKNVSGQPKSIIDISGHDNKLLLFD
jgi:hypothetical protein